MRIREIITEALGTDDAGDAMVKDKSDRPEYMALITALENLRNSNPGAKSPSIEADVLINMVKHIPGGEGFHQALLDSAAKDNDIVKGLIKDIKVDPHDGKNYVNLMPSESATEPESGDTGLGLGGAGPDNGSKVVASMAKRAAKK
jgi:hypothetical protein